MNDNLGIYYEEVRTRNSSDRKDGENFDEAFMFGGTKK